MSFKYKISNLLYSFYTVLATANKKIDTETLNIFNKIITEEISNEFAKLAESLHNYAAAYMQQEQKLIKYKYRILEA